RATILSPALSSSLHSHPPPRHLPSFPTRRSSDLKLRLTFARFRTSPRYALVRSAQPVSHKKISACFQPRRGDSITLWKALPGERSEEHTSELQSRFDLVCRLLLEKKKTHTNTHNI